MGNIIDFKLDIDEEAIGQKLESLIDDSVMLEIHNLFAKILDPYVPMDEGYLSQSVEINPEYIRYKGPYAHYMYEGIVYGPNIPIIENGIIVGWFSPPGKKKYPTGASIVYGTEKHPKATAHWDKVAMQTEMQSFEQQVKEILVRRAKELYG